MLKNRSRSFKLYHTLHISVDIEVLDSRKRNDTGRKSFKIFLGQFAAFVLQTWSHGTRSPIVPSVEDYTKNRVYFIYFVFKQSCFDCAKKEEKMSENEDSLLSSENVF